MERCPRCGAAPYGEGFYKCGSTDEGFDPEHPAECVTKACLHAQLAAARATVEELVFDKESAAMAWRAYRDYPKPGTIAEVELGNYFAGMGED